MAMSEMIIELQRIAGSVTTLIGTVVSLSLLDHCDFEDADSVLNLAHDLSQELDNGLAGASGPDFKQWSSYENQYRLRQLTARLRALLVASTALKCFAAPGDDVARATAVAHARDVIANALTNTLTLQQNFEELEAQLFRPTPPSGGDRPTLRLVV